MGLGRFTPSSQPSSREALSDEKAMRGQDEEALTPGSGLRPVNLVTALCHCCSAPAPGSGDLRPQGACGDSARGTLRTVRPAVPAFVKWALELRPLSSSAMLMNSCELGLRAGLRSECL